MNMKKLISTILAATLTVGMCTHIAFGSDFVEGLSAETISAEVETEEIGDIVESEREDDVVVAMLMDDDEFYIIESAEQLAALGNGSEALKRNYKLGCDIVLPDEWTPIYNYNVEKDVENGLYETDDFCGVFDGNGYTITMSGFVDTDKTGIGIFQQNYGEIKNLNVHVNGSDKKYSHGPVKQVGTICGRNSGTITNCSVSGNFNYLVEHSVSDYSCRNSKVGGIVGENFNQINQCSVTANIFTDSWNFGVGGIAAFSNAVIENCYYKGTINAYASNNIGGLVGVNFDIIRNSYAEPNNYGVDYIGALAGKNNRVVENSYYYVPQGAAGDNNIGTPLSLQEVKNRSTYYGWDFITTWGIDEQFNDGRPYLLSEVYGVNIKWPEVNVGKVEKSVDKEDNKVSVSTTVSNSEERSVPVNVIVAIYDENNVYRGQERVEMVLEPGNNTISLDNISIIKYDPQKKYYGKVMVWDSMYGASPLSDAPIFEIQ